MSGGVRTWPVVVGAVGLVVALAVVLVVVRLWPDAGAPPGGEVVARPLIPAAPPSPELAGRFVVVSYVVGDEELVLDPDRGEYVSWRLFDQEIAVAPHLRLVARNSGELQVGFPGDGRADVVEVPVAGGLSGHGRVVWSPEGMLAAVVVDVAGADPAWPEFSRVLKSPGGPGTGVLITQLRPFDRVVVFDAVDATVRVVELALPAGQLGSFGGTPVWLDGAHLAVPTTTVDADAVDPAITDAIGVFDLDGRLVRQVPLAEVLDLSVPEGSLVGYGWELVGVLSTGEFLLAQSLDTRTLQFAAVPDGGGPARVQTVSLPEPLTGLMWVAQAVTVLGGSEVLVHAAQVVPVHPVEEVETVGSEHMWLVVDMATGEVELPARMPIPDGASRLGVGAAEWLAPEAASRLELAR